MDTFVLSARGPFSLSASTGFLEGFTPAAFTGTIGQPLELSRSRELGRPPGRVLEHPGGVQCEVISPVAPGPEALAAVRAPLHWLAAWAPPACAPSPPIRPVPSSGSYPA